MNIKDYSDEKIDSLIEILVREKESRTPEAEVEEPMNVHLTSDEAFYIRNQIEKSFHEQIKIAKIDTSGQSLYDLQMRKMELYNHEIYDLYKRVLHPLETKIRSL
jgi:hypothetical protein